MHVERCWRGAGIEAEGKPIQFSFLPLLGDCCPLPPNPFFGRGQPFLGSDSTTWEPQCPDGICFCLLGGEPGRRELRASRLPLLQLPKFLPPSHTLPALAHAPEGTEPRWRDALAWRNQPAEAETSWSSSWPPSSFSGPSLGLSRAEPWQRRQRPTTGLGEP